MKFIDIHTHIYPAKIQTDTISCYNISLQNNDRLAENGYYSAGIHPWFITDKDSALKDLSRIRQMAKMNQIMMIGEAGLDKMVSTPLELQTYLFEQQILLAEEFNKPLVIHCVKAWNELILLHKKYRPSSPWVIHGFRGKGQLAEQLIREKIHLSFGEHFQPSALQVAWPDRLFIETDESTLPIQQIYDNIAHQLNVETEVLCRTVETNFCMLTN